MVIAEEALKIGNNIRMRITVFNQKWVQNILIHDIKAPLCRIVLGFTEKPLTIWGIMVMGWELYRILRRVTKLPQPDLRNTHDHNTHIVIKVTDKFFQHLDMPSREPVLRAMAKLAIIEFSYNRPYRALIKEWIKLWLKEDWLIEDWEEPSQYWRKYGD